MIPRQIKVTVEENLCKGCGICILFCPTKILEEGRITAWGGQSPCLKEGGATKCMLVQGKQGVACRLCEKRCPDAAIVIEVEEQ